MEILENIEFGRLLHSYILRDGGSAIITIDMTTYKINFRVMRSISEQKGDFSNYIEASIDRNVIKRVKNTEDIDGLKEFLNKNRDKIDPKVIAAFDLASRR